VTTTTSTTTTSTITTTTTTTTTTITTSTSGYYGVVALIAGDPCLMRGVVCVLLKVLQRIMCFVDITFDWIGMR
jgi:hypothetical protein